jgi:hypothetical protein
MQSILPRVEVDVGRTEFKRTFEQQINQWSRPDNIDQFLEFLL